MLYLDTSVLVSIYVPEKQSAAILEFLEKYEKNIYISQLSEAEFFSALAIKKRMKQLSATTIKAISAMFSKHIDELIYEKIHLTNYVFTTALEYITTYKTNLRTLDALHLACCSTANMTLITADHDLAQSAKHFKVNVKLL